MTSTRLTSAVMPPLPQTGFQDDIFRLIMEGKTTLDMAKSTQQSAHIVKSAVADILADLCTDPGVQKAIKGLYG